MHKILNPWVPLICLGGLVTVEVIYWGRFYNPFERVMKARHRDRWRQLTRSFWLGRWRIGRFIMNGEDLGDPVLWRVKFRAGLAYALRPYVMVGWIAFCICVLYRR